MKDRMKELTDHWDRMGEGCNGHPLTFAVADTTVTATCGCGQFEKVETIERDAFCPNAVDDACMNLMGAWEDDHIPIDEGG